MLVRMVSILLVCCPPAISAAEAWLEIANPSERGSYQKADGEAGVSGMLPKGWRDQSGWSGAKVRYAFVPEGSGGHLHVVAEKEGMCQFYYTPVPDLKTKGCFNLVVKGRSESGADVNMGIRSMEDPYEFFVSAKVHFENEWKEFTVPVSGGPATRKASFFVEFFCPGAIDMAYVRMEAVPADKYVPLTARAEPRDDEAWTARHKLLVARAAKAKPEFMIMGDSITQRWEESGAEAWKRNLAPLKAANFGIDGDGTEHLLWRIRNSGLGKEFSPRLIALLIGVNNTASGMPAHEIVDGLAACVKEIKSRSPSSKILIIGLFPNGQNPSEDRELIKKINHGYGGLADSKTVFFADIGDAFLEKDGKISATIMADFLHLTPKGYGIYAERITPVVKELLSR